jgi:hypothetical protein
MRPIVYQRSSDKDNESPEKYVLSSLRMYLQIIDIMKFHYLGQHLFSQILRAKKLAGPTFSRPFGTDGNVLFGTFLCPVFFFLHRRGVVTHEVISDHHSLTC